MKLHITNSLNIQGVFFLVSISLSIISIYDSPNLIIQLVGYFNKVEKQVAYSQYQLASTQKTALGLPKDMCHRSVLPLEVQGFS